VTGVEKMGKTGGRKNIQRKGIDSGCSTRYEVKNRRVANLMCHTSLNYWKSRRQQIEFNPFPVFGSSFLHLTLTYDMWKLRGVK